MDVSFILRFYLVASSNQSNHYHGIIIFLVNSASTSGLSVPSPTMIANLAFSQSTTPKTCAYGNCSSEAMQNSANGDLCATMPTVAELIWACPAMGNISAPRTAPAGAESPIWRTARVWTASRTRAGPIPSPIRWPSRVDADRVHQLEANKPAELVTQIQWLRPELGSVPSDRRINGDEIIEELT